MGTLDGSELRYGRILLSNCFPEEATKEVEIMTNENLPTAEGRSRILSRFTLFLFTLAWCSISAFPPVYAQDEAEPYTIGAPNSESIIIDRLKNTPVSMLDLGLERLKRRLDAGLQLSELFSHLLPATTSFYVQNNSIVVEVFSRGSLLPSDQCGEYWMEIRAALAGYPADMLNERRNPNFCNQIEAVFVPATDVAGNVPLTMTAKTDPCAVLLIKARLIEDKSKKRLMCSANFYEGVSSDAK